MKVHIVTCANRASYHRELEQMHQLRHEVFVDGLGWRDLDSEDGIEVDGFDDDNCVYLLAIDDGEVHGSVRLLPTWRRCMISEIWPEFVMDGQVARGAGVWEWTRWCPGLVARPKSLIASRRALSVAAVEFALSRGIDTYITFCETKFYSQLAEVGWDPRPLGLPRPIGDTTAIAVRWDVTKDMLETTRRYMRIEGAASIEAPARSSDDSFVQPWMLHRLLDIKRADDALAIEDVLRNVGPRSKAPAGLEALAVQGRA